MAEPLGPGTRTIQGRS